MGLGPDASPEDGVTEATVAATPPSRVRRIGRVLALIGLPAAALIAYLTFRSEPYRALRPLGEPSASAYRRGGVPLASPALEVALGERLPRLALIALDGASTGRDVAGDLDRAVADIDATPHLDSAPAAVVSATHLVANAYRRYVDGEGEATTIDALVSSLDEALMGAGLGVRVTTSRAAGYAVFQALRVHHVERSGTVEFSFVERLDRTTSGDARLGGVFRDGHAWVPLHRIDHELVAHLLPMLETPVRPAFTDPEVPLARHPYLAPTQEAASAALRSEFGRCGSKLPELVAALAQRRTHFALHASLLASRRIVIAPPRGYVVDLEDYAQTARFDPRFPALERNEALLAGDELGRVFACLRAAVARAVKVGVAARLALRSQAPLVVPSSLRALIDPTLARDEASLRDDPVHADARAMLAMLAEGEQPASTLTLMLECWTDGARCSRSEQEGSRFVLVELDRQRIGTATPRVIRDVGTEALAGMARSLYPLPATETQRLARAAFARLFTAPR